MNLRYLRGLVLDNLTLKVISFLLAFLLWVQIAGQQRVCAVHFKYGEFRQ